MCVSEYSVLFLQYYFDLEYVKHIKLFQYVLIFTLVNQEITNVTNSMINQSAQVPEAHGNLKNSPLKLVHLFKS